MHEALVGGSRMALWACREKSHLLPAARPVLNRIARLQLHLLADRDTRIRIVVGRQLVATFGRLERFVDAAHLARLASIAAFFGVGAETIVVAFFAEGGGGLVAVGGRRREVVVCALPNDDGVVQRHLMERMERMKTPW